MSILENSIYKSIFRISPDAIMVIDLKGTIIDSNQKASGLFSDNPENQNILIGILRDNETIRKKELQLRRNDGRPFIGEMSASLVHKHPKNNPVYVVIIRDISKRKKKEHEIRQSSESYQTVVESIDEGIIVIDRNRLFTFINPGASKILGYSFEELLGESLDLVLDAKNEKKIEQHLLKSELEKNKRRHFDLVLIKKNNERVYAKMTINSIYGIKGDYLGSFAILTDVTREKMAQKDKKRIKSELDEYYFDKLSEREIELLRYLVRDYKWPEQKREIAKIMDVLPGTLDKFMARIKHKINEVDFDTIVAFARRKIK